MFTDFDLSKDWMKQLKNIFKDGIIQGITINADILTQGYWPEQNDISVKLPIELFWI